MPGSSFVPYIFRCEIETERQLRLYQFRELLGEVFFCVVFGQSDLTRTSRRIVTIKELLSESRKVLR